jgi:leucine dehydrogenase
LSKRSIAIQGIGKVGSGLLDLVAGKMYEVFVTDIKRDILVKAKKKFPKIKVVSPGEIFSLKVDVFSPNALSHALSYANLPKFRCSIVAGAANNQLEDDAIGQILHKQGILYAPDYVINSGGLISVVDEYENDRHSAPRIESKLNNMKETLSEIFKESQRSGKPTNIVANAMAEKIFNKR